MFDYTNATHNDLERYVNKLKEDIKTKRASNPSADVTSLGEELLKAIVFRNRAAT